MHRLIYVSRSLVAGRADIVSEIVRMSAIRNADAGVTGMMWSDGAYFVQALEGNVDAITATFGRILLDKRHTGIDIVVNRTIIHPMFGNWSMVEADGSPEFEQCGTFLLGLAAEEESPAKRRMRDVIIDAFA